MAGLNSIESLMLTRGAVWSSGDELWPHRRGGFHTTLVVEIRSKRVWINTNEM
jgi:hypothetical protein